MASLKYDERLLVYTSDTKGFTSSEIKPLFDRLLAGNRPIVVFVHGRGKEPGKSLQGAGFFAGLGGVEGRAVAKLEDYGVVVVMVSWDSRRSGFLFFGLSDRERALANAPEAGRRFGEVLGRLGESLNERAQQNLSHPPITLLAHSMGANALQKYIEQNHGWQRPTTGPVFTNVILSSADPDNLTHAPWVTEMARVERVFITVNPDDDILRRATEARPPNTVALGRDPGNVLSENPAYVFLRIDAHEIFTKRASHPRITAFFQSIFANNEVSLGTPLPPPGRRFRLG